MITQFNEFINEGFFSNITNRLKEKNPGELPSENDKYIKKFFKEIKENFDFDNFDYYISSGKDKTEWYTYTHDGINIYIDIYKPAYKFLMEIGEIEIDKKEIECSISLKYKILKYFRTKSKIVEKDKKLKNAEELKDKLDPVNRKASEYNM